MGKWQEFREYYKRNPIKFCEDYLGVKLTITQKIRLGFIKFLVDYLKALTEKQNKMFKKMLLEPCGTLRHDTLELYLAVLELRINVIKDILKIE